MKKIIIVDDEKTMCDGLAALIKSTNQYNVVAICKNGLEALDAIEKYTPDIVITDIKMPVMDGLTLIDLCPIRKSIKFIILSGYEEFEYARKAHKLDVYEYLLKPVEYSKFLELLKKLSDEIDEEKKDSKLVKVQIGMLAIQKSLSSTKIADELSNKIELNLNNSQVIIINVFNSLEKEISLLENINAYVTDYIYDNYGKDAFVFLYKKHHVVIFPNINISRNNIPLFIKNLPNAILNKFNQYVLIGIGKKCTSMYEICNSYLQAQSALSESIYNSTPKIYYYRPEWQNVDNLELFYFKEKKAFLESINSLNFEHTISVIDSFLNSAKENIYPPEAILSFFKEIYMIYYNTAFSYQSKQIIDSSTIHIDIKKLSENLSHNNLSLTQIKNMLIDIVNKIIQINRIESSKNFSNTVESAIKYANIHYKKDITLEDISNKFFINVSYFCKIFKEKTGITFNNYLTKIRIDKAKELLANSDYKIYEVSEQVGFNDPKYFAKLFKEITGKTPSEYKNIKFYN